MESVLPHYILENWKLLRQKATQTVLDRGILIPHPKEDYDLLEERLLESLELKTPRILKCGHFHLSPEEEADVAGPDGFDSDEDEDADADICEDCGRRIRDGRFGSGVGSKRWDIKLFAANGLMRAGAWGAAWREMERVDVEIVPWMDDDMKRQLELRNLEESESSMPSLSHAGVVNEGLQDALPNSSPEMDEARRREVYGDSMAQAYILDDFDGEGDKATAYGPPSSPVSHHQTPQANRQQQQQQPPPQQRPEIPLPTLLRNYIYLLISAQDGRNLAIGALSILVLVLTLRAFTTPAAPPPSPLWAYDAAKWHQEDTTLSGRISDTPSVMISSSLAPTAATTSLLPSLSVPVDSALVPDDYDDSKFEVETEPSSMQDWALAGDERRVRSADEARLGSASDGGGEGGEGGGEGGEGLGVGVAVGNG